MNQRFAAQQGGSLSRPQLYGGFGGFPHDGKAVLREQRFRMNLAPVYQCLFIPWLFFCAIYAVMSSSVHYYRPSLAYLTVALCGLVVLAVGWIALKLVMGKAPSTREPNWYVFLAVTMAVAWILGIVFGNLNYSATVQRYYDYISLDIFPEVNPSITQGQQVMSGGRVYFGNTSVLDVRRSIGFKNVDTYCVAPISIVQGGTTMPLQTYDFWAVGLGCCSLNTADFHCGEYNNPNAHSGLRLLEDSQRDFYRLAVQQAEAAYSIKANHPLFFYWVEDATAEMESFKGEGYKYFMIGMLAHFGWQLLSVGLAATAFSKLGYA
eukprot:gb/GFBE01006634.1/.p1 GENE.gb/GFBE01006634.1/~~gb/GFBE01006634.1/.p1  ORF type:complete len:321 (+),score=62.95 gb/GFBE01006634.1/:1-963(+)